MSTDSEAVLAIWLQPRGSRNQVLGEREGAIVIKLQASPVDGAAKAALLRGHTSRRKQISVAGWSAEAVRRPLLARA